MIALVVVIILAATASWFVFRRPKVVCDSEIRSLSVTVGAKKYDHRHIVGTYDTNHDCGCQWEVAGLNSGVDFLGDFEFANGVITAKVTCENFDSKCRTATYGIRHCGKGGTRYMLLYVTQAAAEQTSDHVDIEPPTFEESQGEISTEQPATEKPQSRCDCKVGCVNTPVSELGFMIVTVGYYECDPVPESTFGNVVFVQDDPDGVDFLGDFKFANGVITAVVKERNITNMERKAHYRITHYHNSFQKEFDLFVTQAAGYPVAAITMTTIAQFSDIVKIPAESETRTYLGLLLQEAAYQIDGRSANNLPLLIKPQLFPVLMDHYGKNDYGKNEDSDFWYAMNSWITALLLTELRPDKRNEILQRGYCSDKEADIYGFTFDADRNIARMVASVIYSAMRGLYNPNTATMRSELGGSLYGKSLATVAEDSFVTNRDSFFVEFQKFLPTAPGPYLNGYKDRSLIGGEPYPNVQKTADRNLPIDQAIYDLVVQSYNMDNPEHRQEVIQAIADKEGDISHLVGGNRQAGEYMFHPVFGVDTIGVEISPKSNAATAMADMFEIGLMARRPMMDGAYSGRIRPGGSDVDGIAKDGREGPLIDFSIENCDGRPGSYYDKNGNLIVGRELNPGDYEAYYRRQMYSNSYPSGHSSGIWCAAMFLVELMPERADLIMQAANKYAMSRVICRYHWMSDTIIGRVIGSAICAMARATNDYDDILAKS